MDEELRSAVARAVRLRRAELGISQSELAARSGLGITKIGAVERGEDGLTARTQVRLAAPLDWPIDWVELMATDRTKPLQLAADALRSPRRIREIRSAARVEEAQAPSEEPDAETKTPPARADVLAAAHDAAENVGRSDELAAVQRAVEEAIERSPAFQSMAFALKVSKLSDEKRAELESQIDQFLEDK